MRVLLDEGVPQRLGRDIAGHDVSTVRQMAWTGMKNGDLLSVATRHFDVFVTVDKNLPRQPRLPVHHPAIVVLRCPTNDINELRKLVPALLEILPKVGHDTVTFVG